MVVCPPTLPPVPVELVLVVDEVLFPEAVVLLVELVLVVLPLPEVPVEDVLDVLVVLDVPLPVVLLVELVELVEPVLPVPEAVLFPDVLLADVVFEPEADDPFVVDLLLSTESVTFTLAS